MAGARVIINSLLPSYGAVTEMTGTLLGSFRAMTTQTKKKKIKRAQWCFTQLVLQPWNCYTASFPVRALCVTQERMTGYCSLERPRTRASPEPPGSESRQHLTLQK